MTQESKAAPVSSEEAKFIAEACEKPAELLASLKKQPNNPAFVELVQAYNRRFHPDQPTNFRGCPPSQIEAVKALLAK